LKQMRQRLISPCLCNIACAADMVALLICTSPVAKDFGHVCPTRFEDLYQL